MSEPGTGARGTLDTTALVHELYLRVNTGRELARGSVVIRESSAGFRDERPDTERSRATLRS